MPFLRQIAHLLPTGHAWRITVDKALRRFFEGLAGLPQEARTFIDDVYLDLFPATTRELEEWEKQFGLAPASDLSEANRRLALAAEWAATGGQSPSYIQGVLQAAGFDVYVHDWFASGPPYIPHDPRDYTEQARIGLYQCTSDAFPDDQPQCSALSGQPQCNRFLTNDPKYLVNKNLTPEAPPPIPNDPTKWPHFIYIGAQTFGESAIIDADRRAEFDRLVLKLCPTEKWVVTLVDYTSFVVAGGDENPVIVDGELVVINA